MDNLCARSISRLDRDFMPGRQVVTGGAKRPYAAHPSTYLDTGRLNERRVILIEELHRVGQGETAALKTVYDMTSAKLFGICLSVCGDSERTEDVLQEIYLAVWIAAKNFDSTRSSPITWLSQIARNKAIDEWRKNRRAPNQVSLSHADHIADAQPDAEWGLINAQRLSSFEAGLALLKTDDTRLLRAIFYEGQTYSQIARDSELPLPTVKSRGRRALIALRSHLGVPA